MTRAVLSLVVVSMVLVSCVDGQTGSESTTTAPTATTAPVATTSTIAPNGRALEISDCSAPPEGFEIVCDAYELIHSRFVDPVDDDDLAIGAQEGLDLLDGAVEMSPITCVAPSDAFIDVCETVPLQAEGNAEAAEAMLFGMANLALDPYSAYLDPELLDLIDEETHGTVEGIGALVIAEESNGDTTERCSVVSSTCRLVVVSPIPGSPAEQAGLASDDVIVSVDGVDIEGQSIEEVTGTVRGPAGTDVVLTIDRAGETIDVRITRAAVQVPVISSEAIGRVGYVRLNQFTDTANDQLQEALFDLMADGMETLVFDLRDNPGGLLNTAIEVASDFLAEGDVVETRGPDSSRRYELLGNPIVPADLPVLILVNRGSASASELLAALLQERGRAVVVGENTFGKNTVQQQFNLSNGGALKLTIARWVTPGGLDFGGSGVTPDVSADLSSDLEVADVVAQALESAGDRVS